MSLPLILFLLFYLPAFPTRYYCWLIDWTDVNGQRQATGERLANFCEVDYGYGSD